MMYAEHRDTTPTNNNDIFGIFVEALADQGGYLDTLSSPVVAGLISDAHYNKSTEQNFAPVSTGRQNSSDISLGTFGSYLTYSWPRFTGEVNCCLMDARVPSPKIATCKSAALGSCAFGQSSLLSAVSHAFVVNTNFHEHGE
jgi:hypothetical protein